jgi:hypothetical protein
MFTWMPVTFAPETVTDRVCVSYADFAIRSV